MDANFRSIEWEESMALGVDVIDKQHRFLVETMQQVNERLLSDNSRATLSEVVNVLLSYAITHFEAEEELMQRYGYAELRSDEAQNHIDQHRDFVRQVISVHDKLHEGLEVPHLELLAFLNDWLRNHLLDVDQLFGEFLRQATREEGS